MENTNPPVVIVLNPAGLATARRVCTALDGCALHILASRFDGAMDVGDVVFDDVGTHLRALFVQGQPIVGVCAAGVLMRILSPMLGDKWVEPPVLAVSADGASVVPLLGGHRGANRMAHRLATALDAHAAITTASDGVLAVALDDPPAGWALAENAGAKIKSVTGALLAGEGIRLDILQGNGEWLTRADIAIDDAASHIVRTSDRTDCGDDALVIHPPVLALGVGCERGADSAELIELVERTLASSHLARQSIAAVVSVDVKADEAAVHALAQHLNVPARFFDAATLERERDRLANPSEVVFAEVGCHGVAEGAALAAVGRSGELAVVKQKSKRATCALARVAHGCDLDGRAVGRGRGSLSIVGIGPGAPGWRAPDATRALSAASDVVGYRLYLDLITDVVSGKALHGSELAEEEARVRIALDLAAQGRDVALVSSGDAGIYALAALAFELLDRENRTDWNRLAISVVPGISAMQAAAARIGAPLGHDFCAVSLSDLLTPWEDIEKRLQAAAEGDFNLALYNPVSKRRTGQIERAREILLAHRAPDTPVVLARNLGRVGEDIRVIDLAELAPDKADMLTMVLIGCTRTRRMTRGHKLWVYTPRGYAAKMA